MSSEPVEIALRGAGGLLMLLGLAHVVLPRLLGWHRTDWGRVPPLTVLVIRMHVAAVGALLVLLGLVSAVGAGELVRGGLLSEVLLLAAATVFAARAGAEYLLVPRVLASAPRGWSAAHRLGSFGWPLISALYLVAAGVAA